jgi:hypothetical protein
MDAETEVEAEEEWGELRDADIKSVHAVKGAANGTRILFAKQADESAPRGLFAPGFVRDLIAKSEPAPTPEGTVTMTGSPAAMAALIHGATVRKAAPEPIAKADDGMADDLDPTTVMAEPDGDAPGDEAVPGSPAWEATDAATARKWTALAVRLKNALGVMAGREAQEAASGDDGDMGAVFDLEDAACAVDHVIDTLAGFAVGEQAESDLGAEALDAVGKAMAGLDVAALEGFEALTPVMKAGRVLSAGNEASIRGAVDALQRVLASLPAPTDDGQPVAKQTKETAVTTPVPVPAAPDAAETAAPVVPAPAVMLKAKGDPMVVVCDSSGKPFGVAKPEDIMPIADMGAEKTPAVPDAAETGDVADGAVIPGTQTIAAPVPAGAVAKSTEDQQALTIAALTEALSPLAEGLAQYAQLADVVKGLQERAEKWGRTPDDRNSPVLKGADGAGAGLVMRDAPASDPMAALAKAAAEAPEGPARDEANTALAMAKIRARFS